MPFVFGWGNISIRVVPPSTGSSYKPGQYDHNKSDSEKEFQFNIIDAGGDSAVAIELVERWGKLQLTNHNIIGLRDIRSQDYEREWKKDSSCCNSQITFSSSIVNKTKNQIQERLNNVMREKYKIKSDDYSDKLFLFFAIVEIESWLFALVTLLSQSKEEHIDSIWEIADRLKASFDYNKGNPEPLINSEFWNHSHQTVGQTGSKSFNEFFAKLLSFQNVNKWQSR